MKKIFTTHITQNTRQKMARTSFLLSLFVGLGLSAQTKTKFECGKAHKELAGDTLFDAFKIVPNPQSGAREKKVIIGLYEFYMKRNSDGTYRLAVNRCADETSGTYNSSKCQPYNQFSSGESFKVQNIKSTDKNGKPNNKIVYPLVVRDEGVTASGRRMLRISMSSDGAMIPIQILLSGEGIEAVREGFDLPVNQKYRDLYYIGKCDYKESSSGQTPVNSNPSQPSGRARSSN